MGTKIASKSIWKHVICCMVLLILFVLTVGMHITTERQKDEIIADNSDSETVPLKKEPTNQEADVQTNYDEKVTTSVKTKETSEAKTEEAKNSAEEQQEEQKQKEDVLVEVEKNQNYYISEYANNLKFFAKAFNVNYNDIIADLQKRAKNSKKEFEPTNIGYLLNSKGSLKTYKSIEYGIVEYFYDYVESNPGKVNKKRVPYSGGSKYVENLVIYYTTHIYTNVDKVTALSIGAAESGYYKVKYMLRANNIWGGMASSGLIKYQNIEYGVLSYIRILSNNYYGKGLNTIESIGYKYCPKKDSNGNKIASPHWVSLVKTAKKKYNKVTRTVDIEDLLTTKRTA